MLNVKYAFINFFFIIVKKFYLIFKISYIFLHDCIYKKCLVTKDHATDISFIFYFLFISIITICIYRHINSFSIFVTLFNFILNAMTTTYMNNVLLYKIYFPLFCIFIPSYFYLFFPLHFMIAKYVYYI